ncbi:MAG: hypothetical protein K8T25_23755 [Planctomycetia bacterium]|nr:hypothetical protein [Planctomycetia bacterium]
MTDPSPKPKRRWFQFSLRTLFLVTTLDAILFALLGWWSYKARQQREAVAALEKVGGTVSYNYSLPWTSGMKDPPRWPVQLVHRVGVDYFARVESLRTSGKQVTDANLVHVARLKSLQLLLLDHTQVTDAGLKHLKNLTTLQDLMFIDNHVTDAGMENLHDLTSL